MKGPTDRLLVRCTHRPPHRLRVSPLVKVLIPGDEPIGIFLLNHAELTIVLQPHHPTPAVRAVRGALNVDKQLPAISGVKVVGPGIAIGIGYPGGVVT